MGQGDRSSASALVLRGHARGRWRRVHRSGSGDSNEADAEAPIHAEPRESDAQGTRREKPDLQRAAWQVFFCRAVAERIHSSSVGARGTSFNRGAGGLISHFFDHRACAALRALSARASGDKAAARAFPPFCPPSLPRATAAGFLAGWPASSVGAALVASWTIAQARRFRSVDFGLRERSGIGQG